MFGRFKKNPDIVKRASGVEVNYDILGRPSLDLDEILAPEFDVRSWLLVPLDRFLSAVGVDGEEVLKDADLITSDIYVLHPDVSDFLSSELVDDTSPLFVDIGFCKKLETIFDSPSVQDAGKDEYYKKMFAFDEAYLDFMGNEGVVIAPFGFDITIPDITGLFECFEGAVQDKNPSMRCEWFATLFHEIGHIHRPIYQTACDTKIELLCDKFGIIATQKAFGLSSLPYYTTLAFRAEVANHQDYAIALQLDAWGRNQQEPTSEKAREVELMLQLDELFRHGAGSPKEDSPYMRIQFSDDSLEDDPLYVRRKQLRDWAYSYLTTGKPDTPPEPNS